MKDCAKVQVSVSTSVLNVKLEYKECNISVCAVFTLQTYTCVTCSSTFNGKVELRLHVVSHTGNMPHKVQADTTKQAFE